MSEMNDDEEDSCGNIGTNRYQATPSLQALQQMRNRLHTAFLGKRLMKWTALATGKELRRISELLNKSQIHTFVDEYQEALMQLARCRYQNTEFHKVLLEDVGNEAHIRCFTQSKFIAGVKVMMYEMRSDGPVYQPYSCLGRGGEMLRTTRKTWKKLLQDLVLLAELRASFLVVYKCNRDATKKQNVMQKIIIPKTINTIRYIMNELEELEREDFFRLKKVKNLKRKAMEPIREKHYTHRYEICPHVCTSDYDFASSMRSVCQLCQTPGPPTITSECEQEESFVCATCKGLAKDLAEYVDEVIAYSILIEEASTSNQVNKEDLAKFLHLCQQMKHKLTDDECDPKSKCGICALEKKAIVPYRPVPHPLAPPPAPSQAIPSPKTFSEVAPPKKSVSVANKLEPISSDSDKVTDLKRPSSDITHGNVVPAPEAPCTSDYKTVQPRYDAAFTQSESFHSKAQSSMSVRIRASEKISIGKLRASVSWSIESGRPAPHGQSYANRMKNIQLSSARRGLVLLPAEVSNKVARDTGTKPMTTQNKKEGTKRSRSS